MLRVTKHIKVSKRPLQHKCGVILLVIICNRFNSLTKQPTSMQRSHHHADKSRQVLQIHFHKHEISERQDMLTKVKLFQTNCSEYCITFFLYNTNLEHMSLLINTETGLTTLQTATQLAYNRWVTLHFDRSKWNQIIKELSDCNGCCNQGLWWWWWQWWHTQCCARSTVISQRQHIQRPAQHKILAHYAINRQRVHHHWLSRPQLSQNTDPMTLECSLVYHEAGPFSCLCSITTIHKQNTSLET